MSDVHSLLLLNSSKVSCSYSILFHCARYWALQGNRVLFISKTPLKHIPLRIGNTDESLNPDAFKLIQFMYLADWQELLKQLYSIHLRHNPVSVIIVKNLENYLKKDFCQGQDNPHEDHVSLVCASLLYAISTCGKLISQPTFLINDYVSANSTVEKTLVKNFFKNIWELEVGEEEEEGSRDGTSVKLSKLSNDFSVRFTFNENHDESVLSFETIIKTIVSVP